jgi:hypothetical protein
VTGPAGTGAASPAPPAAAASPAGGHAAGPADAGSVVADLTGLGQLIGSIDHDGRTGWKTTEFWASITTWLLPILTLIFHRDLSSLAVPLSVVAAGAAQAAYTISRAITKKGHATAVASMAATSAVQATASAAPAAPAASAAPAAPAAPATPAGSAALTTPAVSGTAGPSAGSAGLAVPGPAGLTNADGAQLVQAMTAALQALTGAVAKLSA